MATSVVPEVRIDPATGGQVPSDPLAPGQPLAGSGIDEMTPQAAEAFLRTRGIVASWRLSYRTGDHTGYSECWCVAPNGTITDVSYGSRGSVIVMVQPAGDPLMPPRAQPVGGWSC